MADRPPEFCHQVKSAAEVAKIATACEAVSRAFERLPAICAAGDSERAIFQQFKHECLNQGVDDVCYLVGATALGGYRDIISPPSDRIVAKGDVLILDTGCTHAETFKVCQRGRRITGANDVVLWQRRRHQQRCVPAAQILGGGRMPVDGFRQRDLEGASSSPPPPTASPW